MADALIRMLNWAFVSSIGFARNHDELISFSIPESELDWAVPKSPS